MSWKLEKEYRKEFPIDISWTKKSGKIQERVRFVQYPHLEEPKLVQVFYMKIQDTGRPMSSVFNKREDGVDEGNIWEQIAAYEEEVPLEEAAKTYKFSMKTINSTLSKRKKDK